MSELIHDLEITALVHGGRGIGRHDGKAIFVPLTAPGDRVDCRVVRSKKNYAEGEVVELKEPSVARRNPPCPYFGDCGGCQWQHLSYEEQSRWKAEIFADHLLRKRVAAADVIQPLVTAPDEWSYRNRVQFKCLMTHEGLALGFYRHATHSIVDVDNCMLLPGRIQDLYRTLYDHLPTCPQPSSVKQVDIAVSDDDDLRMVLHVLRESREEMHRWLKAFAEAHGVRACIQSGKKETLEVVSGEPELSITIDEPEMKLAYGPGGFVQVNSAQNRMLVQEMISLLELTGEETVLDLFCGMGNFSLPLARRARKVYAVEGNGQSIEYARRNASANRIANVDFHVGDASRFISRFSSGELDLVVLDPPRTGASEAIQKLLQVMPMRILYISCDPATLARDLKDLVTGGYKVVSARPFDLFPQTWHIEGMTLLERI